MSLPSYPVKRFSGNGEDLTFVFESTNARTSRKIIKIVGYSIIEKDGRTYYNLALGDFDEETGIIRDDVTANNGDMRKVIGTVISTLSVFFSGDSRRSCFHFRKYQCKK